MRIPYTLLIPLVVILVGASARLVNAFPDHHIALYGVTAILVWLGVNAGVILDSIHRMYRLENPARRIRGSIPILF